MTVAGITFFQKLRRYGDGLPGAVYGIDYAYGLKPDAVRDGDTLQEHDGGRQQALIAGQTDADKTVRYDNYRLMRNYLSDREFYIGTIIWNKIYAAALWEN